MDVWTYVRALTRDDRVWITGGLVIEVQDHDEWRFALLVEMRNGRRVVARPVWPGAGDGTGAVRAEYPPIGKGDEVILLCEEGDPNQSVAVWGAASAPVKPPTGWDGSTWYRLGETAIRYTTTDDVFAPVVAPFLSDLSTLLQSMQSYLTTVNGISPGTVAQNAVALNSIKGAAATLNAAVGSLKAQVDASVDVSTGEGPHCAPVLKLARGSFDAPV